MTSVRAEHVIGGGDTGGAMSYLLPLLTALREQGCDARLLCLGGGGLAEAAAGRGLPCTVLPMSHPWDPRVMAPLRRHLSGGGPQVVHTHGMRANLPVRMVLSGVRPRPLLFTTLHSDLALDYASALKSRAYGLLDRATRGGVDEFCCVSRDLARRLVAQGVPGEKVHVVHPGVTSAPEGAAGRAWGRRPPTVGTVARLVPVKDLGLLLDAVALVARTVPDVRAVIVGDGPERAALECRPAAADLTGRVEFTGKVVPARPLLAGFDVYASTSESEGVPLSVLEAMAEGLPVVATAVGGLPEAVEDGVSGFLVKRVDDREAGAAALAGRLAELLTDPALRERMGAAGRRLAAERFSSQAVGSTMLNIYCRALAAAKRGRGSPGTGGPG